MSKVAIITGGSSGIGLAIAKRFNELGYTACSWDLNPPPTEDIKFFKVDVTSEEQILKAYSDIKNEYGPAQILVNNCGLQFLSPVEEFPLDKWKLLIDVMLTGTFLCSKTVIKDMKDAGFGRIINISSIHGKLASPFKSAYIAAKHGVLGFAKVLAKETGEFGITVNSICPGFVDTPLMRNQVQKQMDLNNLSEQEVLDQVFLKDQCIKKLTSPEQVADMAEFLASEKASTITGEAYTIAGGWGL